MKKSSNSGKEFLRRIILVIAAVVVLILLVFALRWAESLFDGYRAGLTDVYYH